MGVYDTITLTIMRISKKRYVTLCIWLFMHITVDTYFIIQNYVPFEF